MFELHFTADLRKGIQKTPLRGVFAQGDRNAHNLIVAVQEDGKSVDLSGAKISGYCIRYRDKATVPLTGSVEDGKAIVTLSSACYAKSGLFAVAVVVVMSGYEATVFVGEGTITSTQTESYVDEENVIPSISELLAMVDTLRDEVDNSKAATANATTAAQSANAAAINANSAATSANTAASNANTAADNANKWANAEATATQLAAGSQPTVAVTDESGKKVISFGIPQGNTGAKGDTGATPNITFRAYTGEPGTDVEISQSGTPETPVVDLTIPRGTPGEGAVSTVNGLYPDTDGNVTLSAENVGALPENGDAANALLLGGKGPEYYTNPRNLLKNSDFTNPVNTVGFVSGSSVEAWGGEIVNEWLVYANGATVTLTNSGLSLLNSIYQEMDATALSRYAGKQMTFAAKLGGIVYTTSGVIEQTGAWHIVGSSATPYGQLRFEVQDDNVLYCIIVNDTEATVEWAALYEGAYTADNLPPPSSYPQRLEMLNLGLPVQPRNLLKNSDFTNPVNQRGLASYEGSSDTIDGWRCLGVGATLKVTEDGVVLGNTSESAFSYVVQIFPNLVNGEYTLAVKIGGVIYVTTSTVAETTITGAQIAFNNGNAYLSYVDSAFRFVVRCAPSASLETLEWAALYEGTYTADNVPQPFIYPKRLEMLNLGLPVQPRNQLDNSDFSDLITQAGLNGYHGAVHYLADRWIAYGDINGVQDTDGCSLVSSNDFGYIQQKVSKTAGKTYTAAVCYSCDTDNEIEFAAWDFGLTTNYASKLLGKGDEKIEVLPISDTPADFSVLLYARTGISMKVHWVALYEGAYTAETLPPYVPKGYAVELAACLRHFERLGARKSDVLGNSVYVGSGASSFICSIQYSPKRIQRPSVILSDISNYRLLLRDKTTATVYSAFSISSFDELTSESPFATFRVNMADTLSADSWMVFQRDDNATSAWIDISADL